MRSKSHWRACSKDQYNGETCKLSCGSAWRISVFPTLGAAGPPQTRMGQNLLVFVNGFVVAQALGAAHPAGVEPVVRAHGDGHEAKGAESPRRGQQHHHTPVTQPHVGLVLSPWSPPVDRDQRDSDTAENFLPLFYLCVDPVGWRWRKHLVQPALHSQVSGWKLHQT